MQQLGKHANLQSSRRSETVEKGARIALMSAVFASAVLTGAAKPPVQAYADEMNDAPAKVVSIASTLFVDEYDEDGVKNSAYVSGAANIGEGMASQLVKMQSDALEAMPTQEDAIVDLAYEQLGVPYVSGGTTPAGFDCSGFTQYVYREALGIELPRTAAAQYGVGESVALSDLKAGDLVFWGSGRGIYHVGIYIGDGQYIHAGASKHCICIQSMSAYTPTSAKRIIS